MLKQRRFIISYILNNQPDSIDVQTDAESISDDEAQKYIYEVRDIEQPANITELRIFQQVVDLDSQSSTAGHSDPLDDEARHDQN